MGNASRTRLLPWFNVLAHREPGKASVSAEVFSFLGQRLRWISEDRQLFCDLLIQFLRKVAKHIYMLDGKKCETTIQNMTSYNYFFLGLLFLDA